MIYDEKPQNSVSCNATWIPSSGIIERRCGNEAYDPNLNLDINATTTKTINISINSGDNPWIFTPRGTTTTAGQVRFNYRINLKILAKLKTHQAFGSHSYWQMFKPRLMRLHKQLLSKSFNQAGYTFVEMLVVALIGTL